MRATSTSTTAASPVPSELGVDAAAAIRDITRRIAAGRTPTLILADDPAPTWAALRKAGWDGVGLREADGSGATLVDLVAVASAWGETCLPVPLIPTILARRWSPAAAVHEAPVSLSVPHPSRPGGLVPFGTHPGIVLAPCLDSDGPADHCARRPQMLHETDISGAETTSKDDVRTDRAPEPISCSVDDLAPTLALGHTERISLLGAGAAHECAVVWAGEALGAATRLLSEAVAYAKLREQFGRPIGEFQAVKHLLADGHLALEQAETAVLWAAVEPAQARRALAFAFRATRGIGETSIQVHGGVGFTWELGLHFYLRHIMACSELAGAVLP